MSRYAKKARAAIQKAQQKNKGFRKKISEEFSGDIGKTGYNIWNGWKPGSAGYKRLEQRTKARQNRSRSRRRRSIWKRF